MVDPADTQARSEGRRLTLTVSHDDAHDGICVVAVEGEIDLTSAPELKSGLKALLTDGHTRFVLDLSQTRHMDSTGLGVLIGFRKRLPGGGAVVIAAAPDTVTALFELTGLDRSFAGFATVPDALAHLQGDESERPPSLSADAAMVVGLASTALPFADSRPAEVERWIRILRLHGDASRALNALGLGDTPVDGVRPGTQEAVAEPGPADPIATVTGHATGLAAHRASTVVNTVDLLLAVMVVYGEDFDRVIRAHGSDPVELIERLGTGPAAASIG